VQGEEHDLRTNSQQQSQQPSSLAPHVASFVLENQSLQSEYRPGHIRITWLSDVLPELAVERTFAMRRLKTLAVLFAVLVVSAFSVAAPSSKADVDKRVDSILSKMTLEEKIDYIGGYHDFYIRAIPRLGVRELKMADGPLGVRNYGPSTAYPAGIAMAASWDTNLVNRIGTMMGKDARARGVHFLLGPGMNIYRAPMAGRNFEYFGEDPFLASRMAVADIEGIQSQGVVATAKHFAANNQEWDRHRISSDMDERTLREIYLPAFEASVKEAHVGAIMDSYNLINGVHLTQNGHLNGDILKKDWGFQGVVMSDWDATYDGVAAANGGLDLEMPYGKLMTRETLMAAVQQGKVSVATLDDKVRRILRLAIEHGWFDHDQIDKTIPLDNPEAHKVALEAALGGMVLLKNDGNLLPFDKSRLKTVAVIGPEAAKSVTGGSGSSHVRPFEAVTFLKGIQDEVGNTAKVIYAPGLGVPTENFEKTEFRTEANGGEAGLKAEYFNNPDLKGEPALTRVDKHVDFQFGENGYASGAPASNFSARWSGYYIPQTTGEYEFYVSGDDGYRLYVDDQKLIEDWTNHPDKLASKAMKLEAGHPYKVRLEYYQSGGDAAAAFGIGSAQDSSMQTAVEAAKHADAVVLCVGFDANTEGEGSDRTYGLPNGQEELIKSIVAANPKTVMVLTGGGSVRTEGWIDRIPALLHAWYPGQEGGTAVAKILFGEVSPSGKLPISWERRWEDSATYNSYYDPNLPAGPGGDRRDPSGKARGHVKYSEGVFLGYRHFDRTGVKPLFPFGYGLSYTTFEYRNLKIAPVNAIGNTPVNVSFDITNTGKRAGAEVAEVYVGDPHSKIERPVKELKGFSKVYLKPGETRHVTVALNRRAFSYYDVNKNAWTVEPAEYTISVGSSSEQIRFSGHVNMK
jgi:beta-glucosidase